VKFASKILLVLCGSALAVASAAAGCSGDNGGSTTTTGTPGGTGGGAGTGGSDLGFDAGVEDAPLNEDVACAATKAQADYEVRPIDLILVIDNSNSMTQEIVSIQSNINEKLTKIIEDAGIDYRVIVVSEYGTATMDQSVCIPPPLGGADCAPLPPTPASTPRFFHYSVPVNSYNSLCRLIDTYSGTISDEFGQADNGWREWLRPDALKAFVAFTDDVVNCQTAALQSDILLEDLDTVEGGETVANLFDETLRTLDPAQFGTATERNFMFFSFVGISANDPTTAPWPPTEPVQLSQCPSAVAYGTGYQALSVMTGGYRFPICNHQEYDGAFQEIANSVISGAKLACEINVPAPPDGQEIDLDTVRVEFTPTGGDPQVFEKVASAAECTATSFYIENNLIKLCPAVCDLAQADNTAQINILYGCSSTTN